MPSPDSVKLIVGFDYERLGTCQYPVPAPGTAAGEAECGEPAVYRGWWFCDGCPDVEEILLCEEHLRCILVAECILAAEESG